MAVSFKDMNEIDEKDKSLVSGYISEWADLYDTVVPDLVIYTVLSFYCYVLFGDHHPCFRLSGLNNNTITKMDNDNTWNTSAYSKQWIPSSSNTIIQWRIALHKAKGSSVMIGNINNQHHQKIDKLIIVIYLLLIHLNINCKHPTLRINHMEY